jgi:hypothetical protein
MENIHKGPGMMVKPEHLPEEQRNILRAVALTGG